MKSYGSGRNARLAVVLTAALAVLVVKGLSYDQRTVLERRLPGVAAGV